MKTLTPRELATVLAALRYWEKEALAFIPDGHLNKNTVPTRVKDHFEDHAPLTANEIDSLCEKINVEDEEDDENLLPYPIAEVEARYEMMVAGEESPSPLTPEEVTDIWTRFKDGLLMGFFYEQLNDAMDEAIREVIAEREDA